MKQTPLSHVKNRLSKALNDSMQALEKQLESISAEKWNLKPVSTSWSIAEIVHHLILVEVQRLQQLKDLLESRRESAPPRGEPGAPPAFDKVRSRENPVKTRPEMEPSTGIPAKVLLAGLKRARSETINFVQTADLTRLQDVWINTISLGALNGLEYIEFLAAHMERHANQIDEVLRAS